MKGLEEEVLMLFSLGTLCPGISVLPVNMPVTLKKMKHEVSYSSELKIGFSCFCFVLGVLGLPTC